MSSSKTVSVNLAKDVGYHAVWMHNSMKMYTRLYSDIIQINSGSSFSSNHDLRKIEETIQRFKSHHEREDLFKLVDLQCYLVPEFANKPSKYKKLAIFTINLFPLRNELHTALNRNNLIIRVLGTASASIADVGDIEIDQIDIKIGSQSRIWHEIGLRSEIDFQSKHVIRIDFKLNILLEWSSVVVTRTCLRMNAADIILKMYENDSTKDYTIVASNGVGIKCHGFILAAQSLPLDKMIASTTSMRESKSRLIELRDLSEVGAKLFIQYLYGLEISVDNCGVAVELLMVAHRYELKHFMETLEEILLERDESWYEPDAILDLYMFARLVDEFKPLCDYLLRTMTRMSQDLKDCEQFKKLGKDQVIELLWKIFDAKE